MDKWLKRREKLIGKLLDNMEMIKGSIVTMKTTCSNKKCACHRGEKPESLRLTYKTKGRTRGVYLTERKHRQAQKGIRQFRKAKEIFDKIVEGNIEALRKM